MTNPDMDPLEYAVRKGEWGPRSHAVSRCGTYRCSTLAQSPPEVVVETLHRVFAVSLAGLRRNPVVRSRSPRLARPTANATLTLHRAALFDLSVSPPFSLSAPDSQEVFLGDRQHELASEDPSVAPVRLSPLDRPEVRRVLRRGRRGGPRPQHFAVSVRHGRHDAGGLGEGEKSQRGEDQGVGRPQGEAGGGEEHGHRGERTVKRRGWTMLVPSGM